MLKYGKNELGYYIYYKIFHIDAEVADALNISFEEYKIILTKFNAYEFLTNLYYFKHELDVQTAIEYLTEKYLILNKLIGE